LSRAPGTCRDRRHLASRAVQSYLIDPPVSRRQSSVTARHGTGCGTDRGRDALRVEQPADCDHIEAYSAILIDDRSLHGFHKIDSAVRNMPHCL